MISKDISVQNINMNTKITTYAPVAIPTLNRYEHLQRLIESLEKCTNAEKTEVYVSLDYPPLDSNNKPVQKYYEGWKKNNEYLTQKEQSNGFKNLIVFRQQKNLGISGSISNYAFIYNKVLEKYDRFIATEDDNEFSPCFLEYMNQNFERYKNDPEIYCICGYLSFRDDLPDTQNYTQFKAKRHVAWGVGIWRSKREEFQSFANRENLIKIAQDKKVIKYFEKDKMESILFSLIKMGRGGPILGDVIVAAYMVHKCMRCILPTKSMVRNHGWDGSGSHGGYVYGFKEQDICTDSEYIINEAPKSFTEDFERRMHQKNRSRRRTFNEYASVVSWYLYKYTGIFCEFKHLHDIGKYIKNKLHGSK